MKNKLFLLPILLTMTAIETMSQLPSQTVVFKVRKVDKPAEAKAEIRTQDEIYIREEKDIAFIIVEKNATFQGGDVNTFREWIQQNIVYPPAAAESGISGKVFLQFCVDTNGQVCDIQVLRGIHPELDKEVVRCMNNSPVWIPAKRYGKAVKQQFVVPVIFSLENNEK